MECDEVRLRSSLSDGVLLELSSFTLVTVEYKVSNYIIHNEVYHISSVELELSL